MKVKRIIALEKKLIPSLPCRRIDPDGWLLVGGDTNGRGVLRVPHRMTVEEWESAHCAENTDATNGVKSPEPQ